MPLETIMKQNVTYATPATSVREVAAIMREDDVGAVIVVREGLPVGIVTDRDVVLRAVAEGMAPETPVEQVMTPDVATVRMDQGIANVARKMREARVRRVVVVDDAGNAAGLLSFDDVFDLLSDELGDLREAVAPRKSKFVGRAA